MTSYTLPNPSHEQQFIIDNLEHNNMIIDSVAGSGKTTTNLFIAKNFQSKKILLLTYNAKLKIETRTKVEKLGFTNLEVHSYHSFCVKYYKNNCYTDKEIKQVTDKKLKPNRKLEFDIIVLDETQDMTPLYYKLVYKINLDNSKKARICILGDNNQSIFDFNGADPRFITLGQHLFDFNDDKWLSTQLSQSFRVTNQINSFVNKCLLGYDRMKANKPGKKIRYIICDTFGNNYGTSSKTYQEVMYYLQKYTPEEIFILAPSVKSEASPVRQLANKLSNKGVFIHVPLSDEEKLDQDVLKGKISFCTFHQSKGLERKVVIVFSFDNSYFKLYKKEKDPMVCPNELYVACTRASEQMTLFHHYQNDYLPFLDKYRLREHCDVYSSGMNLRTDKEQDTFNISVTDLTKHIPIDILAEALNCIDIIETNPKSDIIDIEIKTKQDELYESVSEITGIAIPSYFELINNDKMTIYDILTSHVQLSIPLPANLKDITPEQLLIIANEWNSFKTGYIYKVKQILKYEWLSSENLDNCVKRIEKYISKNAKFEVKFVTSDKINLRKRVLHGFVDCIDDNNNNIWEFKCVGELNDYHILQLSIYMYQFMKKLQKDYEEKTLKLNKKYDNQVHENDIVEFTYNNISLTGNILKVDDDNDNIDIAVHDTIYKVTLKNIDKNITYNSILQELNNNINKPYRFYLLNILDNNLIEIKSSIDKLEKMVNILYTAKYEPRNTLTDKEFIAKIDNIKSDFKKSDLITPTDNIKTITNNNKKNVMVLDIETDGKDTIIQIAYTICDLKYNIIKNENYYLNDGSGKTDYYKKISLNTIRTKGKSPKFVLERLSEDMNTCKYIIGHNIIKFDIVKMDYYFEKYDVKHNTPIPLDTMTFSRDYVQAKDKNGRLKNPKLEELYYCLYKKNMDNSIQHTAEYDVYVTLLSCIKLKEKNLDIIPPQVFNINSNIVIDETPTEDSIKLVKEYKMLMKNHKLIKLNKSKLNKVVNKEPSLFDMKFD